MAAWFVKGLGMNSYRGQSFESGFSNLGRALRGGPSRVLTDRSIFLRNGSWI